METIEKQTEKKTEGKKRWEDKIQTNVKKLEVRNLRQLRTERTRMCNEKVVKTYNYESNVRNIGK